MNSPVEIEIHATQTPLSSGYRRRWAALRTRGRWPSVRMCTSVIHALGELDAEVLRECVRSVVMRHEALRTRIVINDDMPALIVDSDAPLAFDLIDTHQRDCDALIYEFCSRQIDMLSEPLFAGALFRLAPTEHILVLALDHMISDGRTIAILEQEIWSMYCSSIHHTPCELPQISVQFSAHLRQCEENRSQWEQQHLPYWKERLADLGPLRIPRAMGSASAALNQNFEQELDGVVANYSLPQRAGELLRQYAKQHRLPVSLVALAVHALLMSDWLRTHNFPMSFATDGRYDWPSQHTVGCLAETLTLRIELREGESFNHFVQRLRSDVYAALSHAGCQFVEDYVATLRLAPVEAYFNWVNIDRLPLERIEKQMNGELKLRHRIFRPAVALGFLPTYLDFNDEISVVIYYRPHIISSDLVTSFVDRISDMIYRVSGRADEPIRAGLP